MIWWVAITVYNAAFPVACTTKNYHFHFVSPNHFFYATYCLFESFYLGGLIGMGKFKIMAFQLWIMCLIN